MRIPRILPRRMRRTAPSSGCASRARLLLPDYPRRISALVDTHGRQPRPAKIEQFLHHGGDRKKSRAVTYEFRRHISAVSGFHRLPIDFQAAPSDCLSALFQIALDHTSSGSNLQRRHRIRFRPSCIVDVMWRLWTSFHKEVSAIPVLYDIRFLIRTRCRPRRRNSPLLRHGVYNRLMF